MNIFKKLALNFKVSIKFRPYFKSKEKRMAYLETLEKDLPDGITSIYKQISKLPPNKYKKEKEAYETYFDRINKHNSEVLLIRLTVNSWSLKDFVKNPTSLDNERLNEYLDIAELIKKYKKADHTFIQFRKEVEEVSENLEEICRQYELFKRYESLFAFPEGKYIPLSQMRCIAEESNEIVLSAMEGPKLYYVFNKHLGLEQIIKEENEKYFQSKINNHLFDSINGHSLDEEQRKAVLTDENSVLVVAGAGSGKTLTICGKVEYLLREEKINPKDVLLLSYSKKSADDLQAKISKIDERLTVGTFHKIGLDILKETKNKTFMVEDQYKAIIEAYFRDEMKNRPHMLQMILSYYALYISTTKHDKKYTSEGELYEELKKSDFTTLRNQLLSFTNDYNARETIKKELVKSFEEMAIANWYFINGIDYIYEYPYEHDVSTKDKRQYMPDFKLKDYPIYHEHYGVDKNGEASQFNGFEGTEYVEGMKWKKHIHQSYGTDCIETYSYEFKDGTIFEKLEKELKERGVEFHPLTDKEILNALDSIYESRLFKSFINLIKTFLSLYKASYRDDSAFEELKKIKSVSVYEKNRAASFLDIVKDIYHYYIDYLKKVGKIDFDDMILQSIEELDNTKNYKYKYIIVDEFQDISISRMKFLKRLIHQGDSKLFAVGDDWQAIYRFSGCDLSIFLEFSKYFGDSAYAKITKTYRNSQELQDIAGPFIQKNPEQIKKSIKSDKTLKNPIQIMYYNGNKYAAFLDTLRVISKIDSEASVLILGRNNKDIEDIELDNRIFVDRKTSDDTKIVVKCTIFPHMKLTFSTVHASKGLEEDYVIIINADDNRVGFPNKMEDDVLLDLVLSHNSKYEYAEERRLWYVALTRTRNYTFIIADAENPSIFLKEIKDQCLVLNQKYIQNDDETEISCPWCKTGRLVLRTNEKDGTRFYGCSCYPYCAYTIDDMKAVERNKRCLVCGDFMVFRRGRFGAFFGCHNYPRCDYTGKYDE